MLITTHIQPMYEEETLQPKDLIESLGSRYKVFVIDVRLKEGATVSEEKQAFKQHCEEAFEQLLVDSEQSPIPKLFISDMFRTTIRKQLHDVCGRKQLKLIPLYHLMPSMGVHLHRLLNTTENDGACEDMVVRTKAYQEECMSESEASIKSFRFVRDKLLIWLDLPPMYDYEYTPQAGSTDINFGTVKVSKLVFTVSRNTDGLICNSVPEIDGDSLRRIQQIINVPCYGVGPQFNEEVWNLAESEERSKLIEEGDGDIEKDDIFTFLDNAYEEYGPKSAAYISLGSYFWPTKQPEIITNIIEATLSLDPPMPFIFATASAKASISRELRERVRISGKGMIVNWVPQVKILRHPAICAFLTHCGWGSLTEAILTGTPVITLPFSQDQPALSAHFTQIQKIGIQLNHFSSANHNLPLGSDTITVNHTDEDMRRELQDAWERLRGLNGDEYRKRIARVKEVMRQSWENGNCRKAIDKLVQLACGE